MRVEHIGDATLYLGDCRDIAVDMRADAILTDPPYGLGKLWSGGSAASKSKWKLQDGGAAMAWDAAPPTCFSELLRCAPDAIIWGGHLFDLPARRGWLIWDKIVRNFSSGVAELAWTTLDQPIRAFNYANGQLQQEGKYHPTQKPLPLMSWCLGFLPGAAVIFDPYMGSGTTGIAAIRLGRKFIGIEIEPRWFDVACRRIEAEARQGRLPIAEPAAATQDELWTS